MASPPRGSRCVTWPAGCMPCPPRIPCACQQALAPQLQVLVVDDDMMCLKVVQAMLQRCSYEGEARCRPLCKAVRREECARGRRESSARKPNRLFARARPWRRHCRARSDHLQQRQRGAGAAAGAERGRRRGGAV